MKKYAEVLKKCALFRNIETENLFSMLSCLGAKVMRCYKNDTVIFEGDRAEYIYILLSGSVQIERSDFYGNRSISATIVPSELFGESFACADIEEVPISAVAITDCEVLLINREKITCPCNNVCDFHSLLIFNLLKIIARKNILLNQKAEITSKRTTREKLITYLMIQAKKEGSRSFTIPYDRQSLADFLEVDRSGLSAEISKLRQEGVLESRKNRFTLL